MSGLGRLGLAWPCSVRRGSDQLGLAQRGLARPDSAQLGSADFGHVPARLGMTWAQTYVFVANAWGFFVAPARRSFPLCLIHFLMFLMKSTPSTRRQTNCLGSVGSAWPGPFRLGQAWTGSARLRSAWLDSAQLGLARLGSATARLGSVQPRPRHEFAPTRHFFQPTACRHILICIFRAP